MESFYYIAPDEQGFKGNAIDELFAAGYYRMQHLMFTCNDTILTDGQPPIPVFWLRTLVKECKLNKTAKTILNKSSGFNIDILPANVNNEVEALYALYKSHVSFSVSSTCAAYLHQPILPQPFHSLMVQVRCKGQLIATGYFDTGEKSIAGIMNIYHPKFHQYSLGKLLILQKLQYAVFQNKQYYYTGYISPGSSRFDYKVFPDPMAVEVLLSERQQWVPYHLLSKAFLNDYYLNYLV